jgi:hypothetical protein
MAIVKLDLKNKDVAAKIQMGAAVETALGDPAAAPYTALAAAVKAATADLGTKTTDAMNAEAAALSATATRDLSERGFDGDYAALGRLVQNTTAGDPVAILATSYALRADAASISSLDYVENFSVTTTNITGTFDFAWDRAAGEKTFELRGRKVTDPVGVYSFTKTTTKTHVRAGGFESGVDYIFEIRSHGAGEMESPWCDPFTKKAS